MAISKTAKKKKTVRKYPRRASEVPVTQAMLFGVRDELKAFVKSEIHGVKSEIHGIKSENQGIKSETQGIKSEIHRLALLIEEQNARNRIVLDGLTGLFARQDRVEGELTDLKEIVYRTK
jgi:hypothetical protein